MDNALIANAVVFDSDGIMCSSFMGDIDYLHDVYVASFDECPNRYVDKVRNGRILFDNFQVVVNDEVVLSTPLVVELGFSDFIESDYYVNFYPDNVKDSKFAIFLRKAEKELGCPPVRGDFYA